MDLVERFGRWHHEFSPLSAVTEVQVLDPSGSMDTRPVFIHQPFELAYDHHGYESIQPHGEPVLATRFTPVREGAHRYRALHDRALVGEGTFLCTSGAHPGYVQVSPRDPRYFSFSNGESYCAIGPCLCSVPRHPLPRGMAHFDTGDAQATLGVREYRRWFRLLAQSGGNYCRIWLSNPLLTVETEVAGELDWRGFARLDAIVDLARQYGIRLKLCFDHFRTFEPGTFFAKVLRHPRDGRSPTDIDEWLQDPTWRSFWLYKVSAYMARYANDPTIMAWELWNEMDCVRTSHWELVREWTRDMLREIKRMAPRQLVTNSLGSFDDVRKQRVQDDFRMAEMDFQQVHRYLDQGAPWEIANLDPVAFSVDAVQRARRPDRPIFLAETGAVNDRHTGPFRFYRMDERGILFHDTAFPALFAGAAGTGHIWHWDQYVDQKDLWRYYRPLADLLAGVQLDAEGFRPVDLSTERAWLLGLHGRQHLLLWVRNKADNWHAVLRDECEPALLDEQVVDLSPLGILSGRAETIWPWGEDMAQAQFAAGRLRLPPFRYGLMIRIRRQPGTEQSNRAPLNCEFSVSPIRDKGDSNHA